eukprot:PhF_6_TR19967/c0_g1_i1/m.29109
MSSSLQHQQNPPPQGTHRRSILKKKAPAFLSIQDAALLENTSLRSNGGLLVNVGTTHLNGITSAFENGTLASPSTTGHSHEVDQSFQLQVFLRSFLRTDVYEQDPLLEVPHVFYVIFRSANKPTQPASTVGSNSSKVQGSPHMGGRKASLSNSMEEIYEAAGYDFDAGDGGSPHHMETPISYVCMEVKPSGDHLGIVKCSVNGSYVFVTNNGSSEFNGLNSTMSPSASNTANTQQHVGIGRHSGTLRVEYGGADVTTLHLGDNYAKLFLRDNESLDGILLYSHTAFSLHRSDVIPVSRRMRQRWNSAFHIPPDKLLKKTQDPNLLLCPAVVRILREQHRCQIALSLDNKIWPSVIRAHMTESSLHCETHTHTSRSSPSSGRVSSASIPTLPPYPLFTYSQDSVLALFVARHSPSIRNTLLHDDGKRRYVTMFPILHVCSFLGASFRGSKFFFAAPMSASPRTSVSPSGSGSPQPTADKPQIQTTASSTFLELRPETHEFLLTELKVSCEGPSLQQAGSSALCLIMKGHYMVQHSRIYLQSSGQEEGHTGEDNEWKFVEHEIEVSCCLGLHARRSTTSSKDNNSPYPVMSIHKGGGIMLLGMTEKSFSTTLDKFMENPMRATLVHIESHATAAAPAASGGFHHVRGGSSPYGTSANLQSVQLTRATPSPALTPIERRLWVKDDTHPNCQMCSKPFVFLLRRRHHCRACGGLVCGECSATSQLLNSRVCRRCHHIEVAAVGNVK